jgi:hypothetical protein
VSPRVEIKRASHASTSSSGADIIACKVLSVAGNVAKVMLQYGHRVESVRTDVLPAKGAKPQAGESWILDQRLGQGWYFAAVLDYAGIDALDWLTPILLGSWANTSSGPWSASNGAYAPVGFARDGLGEVVLRGTATGPTNNSDAPGPIAADIFQLPDGYRPGSAGQLRFGVMSGNNTIGSIVVRPDGFVRAVNGSNQSISLDGIRFRADSASEYNVRFEPLVTFNARGEPLAP